MCSSEKSASESGWCVYILECHDKTLYTGVTNNLENRVQQHNFGQAAAKYTRARRPVKLVYHEECPNKREAMQREYVIKKLRRSDKLNLISQQ